MQQSMIVTNITLLLQAAGGLLSAAVFFGLYRHFLRVYLLHWTWSWLALAVHVLADAAALQLASSPGVERTDPSPLALAVVGVTGAYLHVALLLTGAYQLTTGRTLAGSFVQRSIGGIVLVGTAAALVFAFDPDGDRKRFFVRGGLYLLVTGVAMGVAAVGVWRASRERNDFGPTLVAGAFLANGLQQLHLFVARAILPFTRLSTDYVQYLGFGDFLLQMAIGFGLVIWLLENERRTALIAAAQIEHLAYHDTLTGLPNRQLFLDRLHLAIANAHRAGHRLAVLFFDIDRFKVINDSLGHLAGDGLLRAVATRISDLLRANDTVARLGGDEFTILAPQIFDADDAIALARKVREAMKIPFTVDERELFASASVGISIYPDDGDDAGTLLKNADIAMYRAKAEGRDTFQLYTPAMNARALEQLALENSLRRAVISGELVLHYQPIIDLERNRVHGVESLVRWHHPELGLLAPDRFISLAEATGLIVPVGEWVLRTSCHQLREWRVAGFSTLRAALNLSARQLQQPDFIARVAAIVGEEDVPFDALEFEVTESLAMHRHDGMIERVRELKALGVHISVDDFGTGYSSLSALQLLPVDSIKIDRSFVHELAEGSANAGVSRAVVSLGRSLGLRVVAEGIETETQLAALRELRCDGAQGFLLGAPMDAAGCRVLLDRYVAGARSAGQIQPARVGEVV